MDRGSHDQPVATSRLWPAAVVFLVSSPLAAIPLVFALMLLGGDYAFGSAGAESGLPGSLVVALKRTLAAVYITVIYIGEHFLTLGLALIAASYGFARLATGVRGFAHRALLAMLLAGVLYPSFWVVAEILDWDAGLFN